MREPNTRFGSGLHDLPEDALTEKTPSIQSCERPVVEAEVPTGEPAPEQQAFIGPDGQVHQIPPELIGPDGKMLPFNERTMAKLRGKYFSVEHPWLEDCGHRLDMINFPKRNCETCLYTWFNHHAQLVQTAHEFYNQYGKDRLIAMRGRKFVKAFLMFMSTVNHFLEQQKLKEQADGNNNQQGQLGDGTICHEAGETGTIETVNSGGEVESRPIIDALSE